MTPFYKKAICSAILLLVFTLSALWLCLSSVDIEDHLFPKNKSYIPWHHDYTSDTELGGSSTISINESVNHIDFDYVMSMKTPYPYVSSLFLFSDKQRQLEYIDLSQYTKVSFKVKCQPRNHLHFHVLSFDERATKPDNYASYRLAGKMISCDKNWETIEIDFGGLAVLPWWLKANNFDISDRGYRLDRVSGFSFNAGRQGPIDVPANVQVETLMLHRTNTHYVWITCAALTLIWLMYCIWMFKLYTNNLTVKIRQNVDDESPQVNYQALSVKPLKDKQKEKLLSFIASEYANPEINIDYVTQELGINRKKISEYIKEEAGLTFPAYLNMLRLKEAVRLLTELKDLSISEVSFAVGYKNVTYFNTVFKKEYGCTPGQFKDSPSHRQHDSD